MKKKLIPGILALGVIACPGLTQAFTVAEYLDHNRLQNAGDVQTGRVLRAYIIGLVEGLWGTNFTGENRVFCPPADLNLTVEIHHEWIKEGIRNNIGLPDLESRQVNRLLIATLKGKFPCK